MSVVILRGDARSLPLPDSSVDLLVTSPPYFSLRDYRDSGGSLEGQIGAEATPREYIDALLQCTTEWARVLKPSGSMFVVLGDKYSQRVASRPSSHQDGLFPGRPELRKDWKRDRAAGLARMPNQNVISEAGGYVPEKSLMMLPARYAIACVDELGLIQRAEIVWSKGNGLPESTRDRVVRGHETILELGPAEFDTMLHLTRQGRYFYGTDLIREEHAPQSIARTRRNSHARDVFSVGTPNTLDPAQFCNPLGKMPRSVWRISPVPLNVPEHIEHERCCDGKKRPGCTDGLDHHAAYPPELARRVILGWSPNGICLECGKGRWPVAVPTGELGRHPGGRSAERYDKRTYAGPSDAAMNLRRITGYACDCTPFTDHPERRKPTVTTGRELRHDQDAREAMGIPRHHGDDWPERLPVREYHLEKWKAAPTRPSVVLDPFGGTGTSALVADVLGRTGIVMDLSASYCRLARWRTTDPGERARALGVAKPPPVSDDQLGLWEAG